MYKYGCETDHCHFKYSIPLNSSNKVLFQTRPTSISATSTINRHIASHTHISSPAVNSSDVSRYRGLPISRQSRVDYFFGDDPLVDFDNRFAVVLATESVVEDSHDVSEGSLSPVIGDIHSTQCNSGLFCWRLTYHITLLQIWVSGLMMYLMLAQFLVFVAPLLVQVSARSMLHQYFG